MSPKKKKQAEFPYPLYVVRWDDAVQDMGDSEVGSELKIPIIVTVGFLICDDGKKVTLAQEYSPGEAWVRTRTSIPKGMIRDMYELSVG